ncbi:hypothetical protein A3J61_01550 [Candidatus Nomurabacteria bacterium RIFCSPHIGHO2_02_FULL_38_15]|uniref:Uncharacterized protein n=1 Tax=Candidatus Nomurabacteria bacterium RIFCSPHIGHO2_02_FULL_38_15 TaxID=1801752 RepID=A0A1F6VR15_9BACT|nr:MAG: hypothetical protein A3J61_01550 [Candidatus Nomurabacteria bacterium RIFCSPHIGHO2_02_FULL_38_15]
MDTLDLDAEKPTILHYKGKKQLVNAMETKKIVPTDKSDFLQISNLDDCLELLKTSVLEILSKEVSISPTVFEFPEIKDWNGKITSTIPRKLLKILSEDIKYSSLVRRQFFHYSLHEAIIRFSLLVRDGEISLPDNRSIIASLKVYWEGYPCVLRLRHYASGKIELYVKWCYSKALFFEDDCFLC